MYKLRYDLPPSLKTDVIPASRFAEKENELLDIYQEIFNIAKNSGLFSVMDWVSKSVTRDISSGQLFSTRAKVESSDRHNY